MDMQILWRWMVSGGCGMCVISQKMISTRKLQTAEDWSILLAMELPWNNAMLNAGCTNLHWLLW